MQEITCDAAENCHEIQLKNWDFGPRGDPIDDLLTRVLAAIKSALPEGVELHQYP